MTLENLAPAIRPAHSFAPTRVETRIHRDEILVVRRLTKLEQLSREHGTTIEELRTQLSTRGPRLAQSIEAHDQMRQRFSSLDQVFGESRVITETELSERVLAPYKAVLIFGGDNHLQRVASKLTDQLVIGMNADPARSHGALCSWSIDDLGALLEALKEGTYEIGKWTRADVYIENQFVGRALCEVSAGELHFFEMTKNVLEIGSVHDTQCGSAPLIVTGSGSSGWYRSVLRAQGQSDITFDREARELRFTMREPFDGRADFNSVPLGRIEADQEIRLTSLNDNQGVVVLDSFRVIPFPFGSKASVHVSDTPLRIVTGLRMRTPRTVAKQS